MKLLYLFIIAFKLQATETTPAIPPNSYVDKNGDLITILDSEARNKLRPTKEIKASNLYDDEAELNKYKKDYVENALSDKKVSYGTYQVIAGDQLKKISQKLYGTTKRWKELQVLNENFLKNSTIKVGMKLKYIIDQKKEAINVNKN